MRINHNLQAMNTYRQMGGTQVNQAKSMEKLSSGYRINRAGDDAAGLAISEKMRGQIKGLHQASRNAQDGISLIQTAEGALTETQNILQRMRELAVQSSNDTNVDADREAIQNEITQLTEEIDRISDTTEFNTQKLLDGTFKGKKLQIGANETQNMNLDIGSMNTVGLGLTSTIDMGALTKTQDISEFTDSSVLSLDGNDVKDEAGKIVGTHDGQKITFTKAGSTVEVDFGEAGTLVDGGSVKVEGDKLTAQIKSPSTNVLSAGEYRVEGDNLLNSKNELVGTFTNPGTDYKHLKLTSSGEEVDLEAATGLDKAKLGAKFSIGGVDVSSQGKAEGSITAIDKANNMVSAQRAKLGAIQNRLEHTIANDDASAENLQAAESRIRDVDMAKEMMEFTKNNILSQAAQSMLAQANQAPQNVLQLLR